MLYEVITSLRKEKPFVEVNCAAIPEELIESELFGHERGAFTGATAQRRGKFDLANEGTLFLDEIADVITSYSIHYTKLYEPVEGICSKFSSTALATASIAQVHWARLLDGEEVVFKIRRPGITRTVETDVDILMGLAHLVEQHVPEVALYDPVGLVKEFRRTIP